jgi:hypothetical protein
MDPATASRASAFLAFLAALFLVACSRDGAPPVPSDPPAIATASPPAPPAAPLDFASLALWTDFPQDRAVLNLAPRKLDATSRKASYVA